MKIWPFLAFLSCPWIDFRILFVQMKSNCKITVTIEFFVQNGPKEHVSNDSFKNFGFGDLFWPDLDLDLGKIWNNFTSQYFRLVLGSTYGKFWPLGEKCYVWGHYGLQPGNTDFNLWPDRDLTHDLNFKFSKVVWKRLVEIFRMPPRPSLYVHPFSR